MTDTLQPAELTAALTPEAIVRVQEGVATSQNPAVRQCIAIDLAELSAIAQGTADRRVSGGIRRWVMRRFIKACFRVRIENPEHIPTEPNVLTANHLSHLDPFLLLAFCPPTPYYYILGDARTLYNKRWKRWLIGWAGGVIPLERWWKEEMAVMAAADNGQDDLKPLAAAIREHVPNGSSIQQMRQIDQAVQSLLARGDGVMLFPEGRLGEREGHMHALRRGTVLYAMRSGVPIYPVAIIGTKILYFRKQITLRFGPAVHVPHQTRPKRVAIDAALAELEQAFQALLPSHYQEPQGPQPLRHWLNRLFW
ncbi:lysophospholipid acyltransferase family protein [Phormidium tenue]|uniref:1-acyl-sn-glycerol-3-phosphate acyltransferase n=1 Tax=Phormidium tenue NIES-30 TaxID=549789 RepID=A0A1U7J412_9CYAN|nr:lysophospholipid acyltransferase family protein [Phormidium tenue]MBD2233077.1 1-acyl-sn-glycerol-3-phosphate acyltransferase [Phormidium tenue FACHB-1052]OKH47112.1 1-acyl-sn-glycerol-3-phosphate acyltransferase [Phormidium tenue NIES-30]